MIQKTRGAERYGSWRMTCCDEPLEGGDPGLAFAAAEDLGPPHVPGRQVGPGAQALVLVLDPHRLGPAPGGSVGWMRRRAWMLVFSSVEIT